MSTLEFKRRLVYSIPLEIMSRTSIIQESIAKEAINVNGHCLVTYESLHNPHDTFSCMIVTMIVKIECVERVHKGMMVAISLALGIYSPSTEAIQVTDESIMTRDFNV